MRRLLVAVAGCLPLAAFAGPVDLRALAEAARHIVGEHQGVYVEAADGSVLVAQAESTPVHPASVSKVPTTLALLRKFGCDYRFTTTFAATGAVRAGTLEGDLVVQGDGDPFFVDENALLVGLQLRQLGITHVAGALQVHGHLVFDWEADDDGARLRRSLGGNAPAAAWEAVRLLESDGTAAGDGSSPRISLTEPTLRFDGLVPAPTSAELPERVLLRHRSQTLLAMVKALNDYSNNIFKPFAEAAGGAASVEALARSALPESMSGEVTLGDGAGTDPRNRLSPRAAVKLLRALELQVQQAGHSLAEVLPVTGIDAGTLQKRLDGPGEAGHVIGKTGTFGDYGASALVGAVSTTDRGTVYFAILNHGVPVPEARRRQDQFVRVLLSVLATKAWTYAPDPRPAVARAQIQLVDPSQGTAAE